MEYQVSNADRAAFKRCRRQWDYSAAARRHLARVQTPTPNLDRAIRDALAVYYFPGMWDWDAAIVLPLVAKGLDRSLNTQRTDPTDDDVWEAAGLHGHALLDGYFGWAPSVDRFSPVRIETDFDVIVGHPTDPDAGLMTPDGAPIHYVGRIDMLAIDEHDRYWVVRHRVTDQALPDTEQLVLDEEGVTACWAWSRFYDGMEIAGTIDNEIQLATTSATTSNAHPPDGATQHPRGGIPQHEASGGGRGVSSLRRMYVKGRADEESEGVRQVGAEGFRRTVIPRTREEIDRAGRRVAAEALDMSRPDVAVYPNPDPVHCTRCDFVSPCLAAMRGGDVETVLDRDYRQRPDDEPQVGRLGGSPYGVGRGWVPPPSRCG